MSTLGNSKMFKVALLEKSGPAGWFWQNNIDCPMEDLAYTTDMQTPDKNPAYPRRAHAILA